AAAGHVVGDELVAAPDVGVAAGVLVAHVCVAVIGGGVPLARVDGRAGFEPDPVYVQSCCVALKDVAGTVVVQQDPEAVPADRVALDRVVGRADADRDTAPA